jgi:hypothetical protein
MTYLEDFIAEYEADEIANDMHYSIYYIPPHDQPLEDLSYD